MLDGWIDAIGMHRSIWVNDSRWYDSNNSRAVDGGAFVVVVVVAAAVGGDSQSNQSSFVWKFSYIPTKMKWQSMNDVIHTNAKSIFHNNRQLIDDLTLFAESRHIDGKAIRAESWNDNLEFVVNWPGHTHARARWIDLFFLVCVPYSTAFIWIVSNVEQTAKQKKWNEKWTRIAWLLSKFLIWKTITI